MALNFAHHLQFLYSDQVLEDGYQNTQLACECMCRGLPQVDVQDRTCCDGLMLLDVIRTYYQAITRTCASVGLSFMCLSLCLFYVMMYLSKLSVVVRVMEH